jgi:hypothetical protein
MWSEIYEIIFWFSFNAEAIQLTVFWMKTFDCSICIESNISHEDCVNVRQFNFWKNLEVSSYSHVTFGPLSLRLAFRCWPGTFVISLPRLVSFYTYPSWADCVKITSRNEESRKIQSKLSYLGVPDASVGLECIGFSVLVCMSIWQLGLHRHHPSTLHRTKELWRLRVFSGPNIQIWSKHLTLPLDNLKLRITKSFMRPWIFHQSAQ